MFIFFQWGQKGEITYLNTFLSYWVKIMHNQNWTYSISWLESERVFTLCVSYVGILLTTNRQIMQQQYIAMAKLEIILSM